jgi:amino acid transporter
VFLTVIDGFDVFLPGRFSASSSLTAYVAIPIFLGFTLCIGLCIGVIPGQE